MSSLEDEQENPASIPTACIPKTSASSKDPVSSSPSAIVSHSKLQAYPRDEEERRMRIERSKELHEKANEAAER